MKAPISVIIPCYRCSETIRRAIFSITQQALQPEEVLLVEDCSGDEGKTLNSLQRLRQEYLNKIDLTIIPLEKNGGPAGARNAGWDVATQPYIAFLDADDEWRPEKLGIQYGYMRENPELAVTGHQGHQYILMRNNKSALHAISTPSYKEISPLSLLFRSCFPTSSVMLKREISFRFTEGKRYAEDMYLWQQLAFAGFSIIRIEASLVSYYKATYGEGGLSAHLWGMEKGELCNFVSLYQANNISWMLFVAATGFSIPRFVKRLIVTGGKQITSFLRRHTL